MAIIYIPKTNFELSKNEHFKPLLAENAISDDDFNKLIKPFLYSLSGIHYTFDRQLEHGFFPFTVFSLHYVSFKEVFEYTSHKTGHLNVSIQDKRSVELESHQIPKNPDRLYYNQGFGLASYKKQSGFMEIIRYFDELETRTIKLNDIEMHKKLIAPLSLSKSAIDNMLR